MKRSRSSRLLSRGLLLASIALGILSFLYPFFTAAQVQNTPLAQARLGESPLVFSLLLALCLGILIFEMQCQAMNVRLVALLGTLVAVNAALRFIEIAIPGPGGFSPIFFLILLTGYVYGAQAGFLMGALTLLTSALLTGGVGPWLPSQMFAAGWVGMSAPALRPLVRLLKGEGKGVEVALLTGLGVTWGLLYGAIMNLWSWPFLVGPADQYWAPGAGLREALQRYLAYYLLTSLAWDIGRALGNALLLSLFAAPTLRVLRRFRSRFSIHIASLAEEHTAELSQPCADTRLAV